MNVLKICTACGTYYHKSSDDNICPVCTDDRQYVPGDVQTWTTKESLERHHSVHIKKINDQLYELTLMPSFAIGQRAFLILSQNGNVLWDCIPLLDEPTISFIQSKGGLKAIAFSHPHYYSNMNEWAAVFECPVYIHQNDEGWITEHGERIKLWMGDEMMLWNGISIINLGGHFPGSCILRVPFLSPGATVFCGDTLFISRSKKHISVMYSYPNVIPLPLCEIKRIKMRLDKITFDSIHGAFAEQTISADLKNILNDSFNRYTQ